MGWAKIWTTSRPRSVGDVVGVDTVVCFTVVVCPAAASRNFHSSPSPLKTGKAVGALNR